MATQHADRLPRYKHLRQVGLEVNNRLVKTLSRADLDVGGKRLGLLRNGKLVFDTQDEMSVLMDYCLHDVRRQGVTTVERFLAESPPAPDSDEMAYLQALRQARYSIFTLEASERGVGIQVRDLLRDESMFLTDVGLSQSGVPGMTMATRVIAVDGFDMTTGAGLPVGTLWPAQRAALVDGLKARFPGVDLGRMSPEQSSELATFVIRGCLQNGAAERIAYREPGQAVGTGPGSNALPPGSPAGRNDPCPCGSGKKYKRCCGARV